MHGGIAQYFNSMISITRLFIIVAMSGCALGGLGLRAFSQNSPEPKASSLAAEEKAGCTENLKAIYQAVEAYRRDHKDLPNWLSDLVPQYLSDANLLVCPVCRRTGKTGAGRPHGGACAGSCSRRTGSA